MGVANGGPDAQMTEQDVVIPFMSFDKIKQEPVTWLWTGWIPLGAVTVLEGDPGTNKSTLTLDIAARLSRGDLFPLDEDQRFQPGKTLILSAEDNRATTIKARLRAAHANESEIGWFPGVPVKPGIFRPPIFPRDVDVLGKYVGDHNIRLVIIDPINSFLDGRLNLDKNADARKVLDPLTAMAEKQRVAVILIRHWTKDSKGETKGLYRGAGSIGIAAAARSVISVSRDPDNDGELDDGRRLLTHVKTNCGPIRQSVTFHLQEMPSALLPGEEFAPVRVAWDGTSEITADDVVRLPEEPGPTH
jgi:RecA-family ATPase